MVLINLFLTMKMLSSFTQNFWKETVGKFVEEIINHWRIKAVLKYDIMFRRVAVKNIYGCYYIVDTEICIKNSKFFFQNHNSESEIVCQVFELLISFMNGQFKKKSKNVIGFLLSCLFTYHVAFADDLITTKNPHFELVSRKPNYFFKNLNNQS